MRLAAANANLERAVDQFAKANADIANVDQRIANLNAQRADISGRRAGGIYDKEDGFDLAEIGVDFDGLAKLRATFAAGLELAVKGHQTAVAGEPAQLGDTYCRACLLGSGQRRLEFLTPFQCIGTLAGFGFSELADDGVARRFMAVCGFGPPLES
ncbi:MAG: hypothetical protein WCJ64_14230 [Rhodospirillaceae bacterium]